ncbi:uncharacterized protein LOC107263098 [Cephus cinctus]|uniref:Uncharacterized protein LOC107263098 n=1 Tax=Cephus cinctus TaxID=211228 RepID=A0AAJ7BGD8_CEPCN|nr:uncharacterized protein LOC107263098 [Cephus cinctus]
MAKLSGAVCDTRCQLFYNEIAKNENSLRMKWFIKNRQRLLDNLGSQKLVSKAQILIAENEEKRRQFYREQRANTQVTSKLPEWRPPNFDESVNLDPMRPVDPVTKSIIYERNVQSFITGNNYLQKRFEETPEDRYYFPDCTSWTYGWRMKDYPPVPATKVGIRSLMQATFYRRNASSLQRDPDWYRNCQTGNAKNFNEFPS